MKAASSVAFVLDASVAASWCFYDGHDMRADAAFDLLENDAALVPVHWWFEIRNVVLLGARRGRVTDDHVTGFLARLQRAYITLAPLPPDSAIFVLARKHRLTFYDATYLELAKRENLALATLDGELVTASRTERVPIVGAS